MASPDEGPRAAGEAAGFLGPDRPGDGAPRTRPRRSPSVSPARRHARSVRSQSHRRIVPVIRLGLPAPRVRDPAPKRKFHRHSTRPELVTRRRAHDTRISNIFRQNRRPDGVPRKAARCDTFRPDRLAGHCQPRRTTRYPTSLPIIPFSLPRDGRGAPREAGTRSCTRRSSTYGCIR